jgi:transposase
VLRREGLYHSHIKEWAAARDAGARSGFADARGSASGSKGSAKRGEVERLRAQNVRLTAQLAQTRTALDIMGKAHVLLEMLSESISKSTDTSTHSKKS